MRVPERELIMVGKVWWRGRKQRSSEITGMEQSKLEVGETFNSQSHLPPKTSSTKAAPLHNLSGVTH